MKKIFKSILPIAAAAMTFASCSVKEIIPVEKPYGKVVYFGTELSEVTKATLTPDDDDATFEAAWENNDAMKVSAFLGETYKGDFDAEWVSEKEAFASSNASTYFGTEHNFVAVYPACDAEGEIAFGAERVQNGNKYNGAYDVMLSQKTPLTLAENQTFIFNMDRQTAIAYFHLTSSYSDEKVISAKLSVNEETLAGNFLYAEGEIVPVEESNSITLTFTDAPSIDDLQLWFNVFPGTYTGLTLEVETENHTLTIQNSKSVTYEAGKLYKVVADATAKYVLKDGDYAFTAEKDGQGYIMLPYESGNNIKSTIYTVENDKLVIDEGTDAEECLYTVTRVTEGDMSGYYTIRDVNGKYIYAAGANSANQLKADDLGDEGKFYWSITNAGIVANMDGRNTLRFNSNKDQLIFSCYASGQADVNIIPASKVYIDETPKFKVSATELSIAADGTPEGEEITVTPNRFCGAISAETDVDWLITSVEEGVLIIEAEENTGSTERNCTITLTADGAEPKTISVTQTKATVTPASGSIEINVENSGVTGSYATTTCSVDGITFGFTNWMKSNNIQAKASTTNSLYNSTQFKSPIKKITFVQTGTARAIKVYGGTSEKPTAEITAPTTALTMEFDFSGKGYTYFSMTTPSNAVYFDSITIEYEPESELTSVVASGDPANKTYVVGDEFDPTGLVATAYFDNGTNKVVFNEVEWTTTPSPLTATTTSVSVSASYNGVSSEPITIEGIKVLASVTVSGTATKKEYIVGDTFDKDGLVATANYSDNTQVVVTDDADWTVTPEILTADVTSVSIKATYNTIESESFVVDGLAVSAAITLSAIEIETAPTKVTYTAGEKFDPTGLVITRKYSNETSDSYTYEDHESEFSFNPALDAELATTDSKVTITYRAKTVDQVITVKSIANTQETAYTVAEARALIDAGKDLDTPVYVKGKISEIVTAYNSQYGNISFNISANGSKEGDQFQFYRNFKGANKTKWPSADSTPKVGDEVIGYGTLTKYGSTYEFAEGNYTVSIVTPPYLNANASTTSVAASGGEVTITVITNVPTGWTATSTDNTNFAISDKTENSFKVVVAENTDTENGREATITVSAEGVESKVITLTQAKAGGSSSVEATFGSDWNSLFGTSYNGTFNPAKNNLTLDGTANGASITVTNGSSTNGYIKTSDFRAYNGYTITLTAPTGKNITAISSTKGGKNFSSGVSAKVGTVSISSNAISWTGSSNSVVLSISGTVSFATITVTYE